MNETKSKQIALNLLKAVSTQDVNEILGSDASFSCSDNWKPYGGSSKNWQIVNVQHSDPVGAFTELIINSIDAILMRKAVEQGIDAQSDEAPTSMQEAVKMFFDGIVEGKISQLSAPEQTKLAEENILVGIKRAEGRLRNYPTYTITDFGEGQNADKFPRTLLSLGEKNKEAIHFVQGRFNMGSTGSLVFCTRGDIRYGHYKFVLSKRTLSDSDDNWGWTLIRVRLADKRERLPTAEYFCPGNQISRFQADRILSFGQDNIGVAQGGTIIKLYEYDIGPNARAVNGLYDALTTSLLDCALPIRIYDFGAVPQERRGLRHEGIVPRTFSGMRIAVSEDMEENIDMPRYLVAEDVTNSSLGKIRIFATGVKKFTTEYLRNYKHRCFYTVNGQSQAKEFKSFFNNLKLGDLSNNVIVQIDCDDMDRTAQSTIFKPDRERMSKIGLTRELRALVKDILKGDSALRKYARKIRQRRISETIEDSQKEHELWNILLKSNPDLKELMGSGNEINQGDSTSIGVDEFKGEKFPTMLKLIRPSDKLLKLPANTYRYVECKTDVEDEYIGRAKDTGSFYFSLDPKRLPYSASLRSGKLRFAIHPPENAEVGDTLSVRLGLNDSSRAEPLCVELKVEIIEAEKKKSNKRGTSRGIRIKEDKSLRTPDIRPVYKRQWEEHGFDMESGARCDESDEGVIIYVNADNKYLRRLLAFEPENSDRDILRHLFNLGVGILTLSTYKKMQNLSSEADRDEAIGLASSAISAHIVTLIRTLGRHSQ